MGSGSCGRLPLAWNPPEALSLAKPRSGEIWLIIATFAIIACKFTNDFVRYGYLVGRFPYLPGLNADHLPRPALGFEDIGHPAGDAYLHLVSQVIVVQAGAAQDQPHAFCFQRAQ